MSTRMDKAYPRLWSLEAGLAMVVTDLHGDWDIYQRYRDRFVTLQSRGAADYLIFTGDLIHGEPVGQSDKSVEIVLDVLALQATYGSAVIYLCGNHEMPHVYGIGLAKGSKEYTSAFETTLSQSGSRTEVLKLFDSLPFYLRTQAGVSITHAGAPAVMTVPENAVRIFTWSHQDLLDRAEDLLSRQDVVVLRRAYAELNQAPSYGVMARHYLGVSGPNDARYDHLLRGFLATSVPSFDLLWSALFTRCEEEYGRRDYAIFLDAMLKELGVNYVPQQVLVSGHLRTPNGHKVIAHRQLRLASGQHARPREAGQYLIFDTARRIESVEDLKAGLGSVY